MYGISNSQQQGGGGGGAASYKAIKSTLTPSDWQEVAGATPYFVGDDATTWATDSDTQQPTKTNNSNLGIIAGQQYTITITANGVTYSSTATAESVNNGMLMLTFTFSETANAMFMLYDHIDWATKTVGDGSAIMVNPGQNTSLVITNFAGEGFGTTIQATIADSAIKVNSAVTIYTNTSEKIAVGEKTNGSITLTAPSVPNAIISYSLEIVGTDTEGLFELVNGYIPEIPDIPDTPSGVPQWNTIFESATPVVSAEIGNNKIQPGQLYRITVDMSGEANPDKYDMFIASSPGDYYIPFSQVDVSGSSPSSVDVTVFRIEYTSVNSGVIHLSPIAIYGVTSAGITGFFASNNASSQVWKFTKLEVYR